jgi:hypothetical protein
MPDEPVVGELDPVGPPVEAFSLDPEKIDQVLKFLGAMPAKLEPILKRLIASNKLPPKLQEYAIELQQVLEFFDLVSDIFG